MNIIYVWNINPSSGFELYTLFRRYGNITNYVLNSEHGKAKITYDNDESADLAIAELNGRELDGRRLEITRTENHLGNPFNDIPERRQNPLYFIHVYNIDHNDRDIIETFEQFDTVSHVNIYPNDTARISYTNEEDANRAVRELNGRIINGRRLRVIRSPLSFEEDIRGYNQNEQLPELQEERTNGLDKESYETLLRQLYGLLPKFLVVNGSQIPFISFQQVSEMFKNNLVQRYEMNESLQPWAGILSPNNKIITIINKDGSTYLVKVRYDNNKIFHPV